MLLKDNVNPFIVQLGNQTIAAIRGCPGFRKLHPGYLLLFWDSDLLSYVYSLSHSPVVRGNG
jgi:hypothetical protein